METKLKKWTLKRWKQEAWKYCSIYNRKKNTFNEIGACCTCNKTLRWDEGDAGHFMAGRTNAILFYDRGIHLQCKNCNRNQGEQYLYSKFIETMYGIEEVKKQERLRYTTKKYSKDDYIKMIKEYKIKIDNI